MQATFAILYVVPVRQPVVVVAAVLVAVRQPVVVGVVEAVAVAERQPVVVVVGEAVVVGVVVVVVEAVAVVVVVEAVLVVVVEVVFAEQHGVARTPYSVVAGPVPRQYVFGRAVKHLTAPAGPKYKKIRAPAAPYTNAFHHGSSLHKKCPC